MRISRRAMITALPLILVNVVAISGQYAFLRDHLSWGRIGTLTFAAALESIAIYLAYMAHVSLLANDSALRLRLSSYIFGFIAGAMNYSHYAPDGKPTFVAVATGLMSASSPWLWAIYSRRQSRDALAAAGLIETHAVRLGVTRWLWHPRLAFAVFSRAAWSGEQNPQNAISDYENALFNEPEPEPEPEPVPVLPDTTHSDAPALPSAAQNDAPALPDAVSKADAVRHAIAVLCESNAGNAPSPASVTAWLAARGTNAAPGYVRDVVRRDRAASARNRRAGIRAVGEGSPTG
jgi:hypothetical protein